MIPQLKPDIYRCIAECLAPTPTQTFQGGQAEVQRYQHDMSNLMKSSKVRGQATASINPADNVDSL
jgi:hypothetical protein